MALWGKCYSISKNKQCPQIQFHGLNEVVGFIGGGGQHKQTPPNIFLFFSFSFFFCKGNEH